MSFLTEKLFLQYYLIVIIGINIFMGVTIPTANAGPNSKQTLVLDPGHGGLDSGARGDSGVLEKTVTLTLARIIADEIEPGYHVVLTRTDDYRLDLPDRAAVANHEKADLFISLHTGGSFYHQTSGMTVFYHAGPAHSQTDVAQTLEKTEPDDFIPWDDLYVRHRAMSRRLARAIQFGLESRDEGLGVIVREAPIRVLSGVNAPAVLLEFGYLTNPGEEKRLKDSYHLRELAKGIILGIDSFFGNDVPPADADLRE
jgi:N-acetylmuramoyl-L-alanine amidase